MGLVVLIACAMIFYRIGDVEFGRGWLFALISVVLSLAVDYATSWGIFAIVAVNVALFAGITIYKIATGQSFGR